VDGPLACLLASIPSVLTGLYLYLPSCVLLMHVSSTFACPGVCALGSRRLVTKPYLHASRFLESVRWRTRSEFDLYQHARYASSAHRVHLFPLPPPRAPPTMGPPKAVYAKINAKQALFAWTKYPFTKNFNHLGRLRPGVPPRDKLQNPIDAPVSAKNRIKYWNIVPGDRVRVRGHRVKDILRVAEINKLTNRVRLRRIEEDEVRRVRDGAGQATD
jgi:hypothetical protein